MFSNACCVCRRYKNPFFSLPHFQHQPLAETLTMQRPPMSDFRMVSSRAVVNGGYCVYEPKMGCKPKIRGCGADVQPHDNLNPNELSEHFALPLSPAFDIIQSHVQPSLSPCSTSPSTSGEENEYGVKMQKSEVAKPGSAALLKEGKKRLHCNAITRFRARPIQLNPHSII